ncbi:MAG: response regulator [Candidatus Marinimicrobia bacterium]|nr:response regulator [Candidatus Neomarinimicrobiota bacterium]
MEAGDKSVLIIEQHKIQAESTYHDIRHLFDRYFLASSAQEVREHVEDHVPDVIITNPFFGDGSGRSCIRMLRKNPKLHATPIIVVSSLPEKQVKLDFYSQGADACFQLPYDREKFRSTIEEKLRRHVRLLANKGSDAVTGFSSRSVFEEAYRRDQEKIRNSDEYGVLGLLAPVGIDFVIRDYGLEAGDKLMSEIARLIREMCDRRFRATLWTQKSILFSILNKKHEDILRGLEDLRKHYLEVMHSITQLQMTPGLRAMMIPVSAETVLEEQVDKLSGRLIQISRDPEADPVQFFAEHVSSKRHIILADPDPVAANIISHRLKKDGFVVNELHDIDEISYYAHMNDLAAVLVDTLVPGGGISFVKKVLSHPVLSGVPMMLLSRFGHEEEIAEAFEAGAEDYLVKPLSLIELSARVKRLTD